MHICEVELDAPTSGNDTTVTVVTAELVHVPLLPTTVYEVLAPGLTVI